MPDRRNTTEDDCGYFEARELWEERRMTDRGERRPRSTISDEERQAAASAASELLLDEYALAAEALTDESAPVFGEWFVGMYVRTIRRRRGQTNPGVHYELMDRKGRFWLMSRESL